MKRKSLKDKLFRIGIVAFLFLSIIGVNLFSVLPVSATTDDDWIGGSNNWSNNGSWSLGAPPTSAQNAVFNGSSGNPTVTMDITGNCLDIDW